MDSKPNKVIALGAGETAHEERKQFTRQGSGALEELKVTTWPGGQSLVRRAQEAERTGLL